MIQEVSKKDIEKYLKSRLFADAKWAITALIRIYDRQTYDEKESSQTRHENGIGFTGHDASDLTPIAEWCKENMPKGNLPDQDQLLIIRKKIPKYWKQIWNIGDQEKIRALVYVWKQKKIKQQIEIEL